MPTFPETTPRSAARHERAAFLLDRSTADLLAAPGNHPSVRAVAQAWLQAYHAARRGGLDAGAAGAQAAAPWDQCCADLRNVDVEVSRGC